MSITDELRKWGYGFCGDTHEVVTAIADRIDAEHDAQLNDAFQTRNSDENLENDGWVRLPVDADGEPVHIGDVMETKNGIREVDVLQSSSRKWSIGLVPVGGGTFSWHDAETLRHYHAPTVEDVLTEFSCVLMGKREFDGDVTEAIAEYAKRLTLAEGEGA